MISGVHDPFLFYWCQVNPHFLQEIRCVPARLFCQVDHRKVMVRGFGRVAVCCSVGDPVGVWLVLGTVLVKTSCLAGRLVLLLSVLTYPTFWSVLSGCFLSKFCTTFLCSACGFAVCQPTDWIIFLSMLPNWILNGRSLDSCTALAYGVHVLPSALWSYQPECSKATRFFSVTGTVIFSRRCQLRTSLVA